MLHVALALLVVAGFVGLERMPIWMMVPWVAGIAYLGFVLVQLLRREFR